MILQKNLDNLFDSRNIFVFASLPKHKTNTKHACIQNPLRNTLFSIHSKSLPSTISIQNMSAINSKNEKSVSTNETDTDINDRSDNSGKEKTDCDLNKYDEYSRFRDLLIKEANYDPYTANPSNCKRQDYIQWEDYFMAVAYLSSQRSKDPKTLYAIDGANTDCETNLATFKSTGGGACIVDSANRIVGIGYNGFPTGCSDDYLPWTNETQNDRVPFLHTKNPYMCHAEVNAILNKCSVDVKGAKLYVLQYPSKCF